MNRISCEICGSSDLIKQDGVFVCQACGCKYSAEEIKKQMVEITNPVQVVGVDNADTLYDRALEWLNLDNTAKAIEVLSEMTEKYPGDKRGWLKLARLNPTSNVIEAILYIGDIDLISEWENTAKIACDEVRKGQCVKWATSQSCGGLSRADFILKTDKRYNSSLCVKQLLKDGIDIANYFNSCWNSIEWPPRGIYKMLFGNALEILWGGKDVCPGKTCMGHLQKADIIIGNLVCYNEGNDYPGMRMCNKIITKAEIQKAFHEAERLIKNKLCPYCGSKRPFLSSGNKCPKCNNHVMWFS